MKKIEDPFILYKMGLIKRKNHLMLLSLTGDMAPKHFFSCSTSKFDACQSYLKKNTLKINSSTNTGELKLPDMKNTMSIDFPL